MLDWWSGEKIDVIGGRVKSVRWKKSGECEWKVDNLKDLGLKKEEEWLPEEWLPRVWEGEESEWEVRIFQALVFLLCCFPPPYLFIILSRW